MCELRTQECDDCGYEQEAPNNDAEEAKHAKAGSSGSVANAPADRQEFDVSREQPSKAQSIKYRRITGKQSGREAGPFVDLPEYTSPNHGYRKKFELRTYDCDDYGFDREALQTALATDSNDQYHELMDKFVIEVINPTTIAKNLENIVGRGSDMIAISEHAVPEGERQWRISQFFERSWNLKV